MLSPFPFTLFQYSLRLKHFWLSQDIYTPEVWTKTLLIAGSNDREKKIIIIGV